MSMDLIMRCFFDECWDAWPGGGPLVTSTSSADAAEVQVFARGQRD